MGQKRTIQALGLISGGLDSQLAVCVLREQGIVVEAAFCESPFYDAEWARRAAAALGVFLHVIDFSRDIVELLEHPTHGFGSCMNPCLDCHARMIARARRLSEDLGLDFVFTGEVLGQRPMSQRRHGLDMVARDSGYADMLLRPLSARLLPPTFPERAGWVDRDRLLDIEGRGRRRQFDLARHYGLKDFPTPAGGCKLTEPNFCRRLRDLKEHEGLRGVPSLRLLSVGRHFRLTPSVKIVVGRHEADNAAIEGMADLYDLLLKPETVPGPTVLAPLTAGDGEIRMAAAICARYSDVAEDAEVEISIRSARDNRCLSVRPAARSEVEALMV